MEYTKSEAKSWAKEYLRGHWSSLVSCFTPEDEVNEDGLRKNIRHILKLGTRGIGCTWNTGEFWALTMEERKKICEVLIDEVKNKALVGVHTTHTCLRDCLELTKHAEEAGADLVIVAPPYYVTKDEDQVYDFIRRVADQVNIGIALYNSPQFGIVLSPKGIGKIAEIENVCAVKEGSVNMFLSIETHRLVGNKIVVSCPLDAIFFYEPFYGIRQQVMFANTLDWMFDTPERRHYVEFINLATEGKIEKASEMYRRHIYPLSQVFFDHWSFMLMRHHGVFPVQLFKYWGELVGMAGGHVRPPAVPMTVDEKEKLKSDLEAVGIIKQV